MIGGVAYDFTPFAKNHPGMVNCFVVDHPICPSISIYPTDAVNASSSIILMYCFSIGGLYAIHLGRGQECGVGCLSLLISAAIVYLPSAYIHAYIISYILTSLLSMIGLFVLLMCHSH
jgi:hypothetical protein